MAGELLPGIRFDAVRGVRKDRPKKPDPAVALEIASSWKIAPDKIAFVGDSAVDMQTANAAGMYAVGVLWGFRPRKEIEDAGSMALVSHPMDLLALLS
jgi:phosphoglycolate phosphatase